MKWILPFLVAAVRYINAAPIAYQIKLLEDADITIWTAPPSKRYSDSELPPTETGSSIFTSAAINEYEPFQVLFKVTLPAQVPVSIDLPEVQNVTVKQGRFSDGLLESLRETSCTTNGTVTECAVSTTTSRHNVMWVTYYVPLTATAGVYNGSVSLTLGPSNIKVFNVTLQIYDFVLPATRNFINLNTVHPAEVFPTGSVEEKKQALFDHRITPSRPTYPASFEYGDSWDTPPAPNNTLKCTDFNSEQSQDPGNTLDGQLAKYLKGDGWNCVGFRLEIGQQYLSDDEYRPASFCGSDIGASQNGTATYNQAWGFFLTALNNYIKANSLEGKVAYNIMKNPDTAEEIGTAGELCKLTKDKAPDLIRIVEEGAREDIISSGCSFDVWVTPVDEYDQQFSWSRQQINQETVWLSPINNDTYPNPYNTTSPGIETRIWGFMSWSTRSQGLYWNNTLNNIFTTASGDIKISFELFREAWEDYEYLFMANGLEQPRPCTRSMVDVASFAIARSINSYVDNDSDLMNVRHAIGLFNENSVASLVGNLEVATFQPMAVNFQDPAGDPTTPAIVINGATWSKQGWSALNADGLGWTGDGLLTPSNLKTVYNNVGDDRMSSAVVDEGKNINSFWYPTPPGIYDVTVGCGDPLRVSTETMNVVVNGVPLITNYVPSIADPFQERQVTIEVTNSTGLEFQVGILGQLTYLMYIRIDYSDIIDFRCQSIVAVTDNSNVQPSCKQQTCTNLGFCPTIAPTAVPTAVPTVAPPTAVPTAAPTPLPPGETYGPTPVPPTPLPPGETYGPTPAPPTAIPPTPLPPGETYGPTPVPPTPLPPGETYGPTPAPPTAVPTAAPTPLPPGETYGPTPVPPTPLPPGETYGPTPAPPTAIPPTPLPPGETYGPTPVPPTPLPPGETYGPTPVPPTAIPPTPLPPGQTYGPTPVPPTPLPPGETYGPTPAPPTSIPPTPLPPGQTYGPTPAPPTPLPPGETYGPTPVPPTPLPPGDTYGPTPAPPTEQPTAAPNDDDELLPTWGWIVVAAGAALLLLICGVVAFCCMRSSSGPSIAPHEFYSPEHLRYESMHEQQKSTAMNTGLRRDTSNGNGVYYI